MDADFENTVAEDDDVVIDVDGDEDVDDLVFDLKEDIKLLFL